MKTSAVLPDLVVATLSMTLWFTPKELSIFNANIGRLMRATGYSTSIVFYGKSYLTLFFNYSRFDASEKKQAIAEDIELELYEFRKEQRLHIEKLKIEHESMKELQPIFVSMRSLEEESEPENVHPELTEEQKREAAKNAVEAAMAPTIVQAASISEEEIRKHFPESMDSTSWKAICKALGNGASKDEIARDVLGCNDSTKEIGKAYLELLKTKFMG
jgi:hypothetical protein